MRSKTTANEYWNQGPSSPIPQDNGFNVIPSIPSIEPKGYFPYNCAKRVAPIQEQAICSICLGTGHDSQYGHSHHFLLQIISLGIGDFITKGTDDHYSLYNPGINTITIAINKQLVELSSFFIICSCRQVFIS
jgi:hypothetical protein